MNIGQNIATPLPGTACRLLVACAVLLAASAACATSWHDHDDIRAAAVRAARSSVGDAAGKGSRFEADRPDPRLRLAACDRPLEAGVTGSGRQPSGRLLAEVRCAGTRSWKLYLPVTATLFRSVVVAARPLARDGILAADDIRLAELDVTGLPRGFVSDPEQVIGQRLRRGVDEGAALTPALLDAAVLVRRGQQVIIEARGSGLAITMAGVARADGALGQTIPVDNLSSGRRLDGVVRSAKSVEVLLR